MKKPINNPLLQENSRKNGAVPLARAGNRLLAHDANERTLFVGPDDPFVCTFKPYSAAETRYLKGKQTAAELVGEITRGMVRLVITIGHTDLSNILLHVADQIGPCDLMISTWDVAAGHLTLLKTAHQLGKFTRVRWVIDCGFVKRDAPIYANLVSAFGKNNVREWRNHAKILLLGNDRFKVCVFTSANLGSNPRQEHYSITENPEVYDKLLAEWIDPAFAKPRPQDE